MNTKNNHTHTYNRRRRRRNATNKEANTQTASPIYLNNIIHQSLCDLERYGMAELRTMCRQRGLNDVSNNKSKLITRLLPYIEDLSFDKSEHHEIVQFLSELGLSTLGSLEEKRSRLEHHFHLREDKREYSQQEEKETQDMTVTDGKNCHEYIENSLEEPRTPPKRKRELITPTTTPEHKMRATDVQEGSGYFNISISHRDVDILREKKELNDNIIDYWLKYLEDNQGKENVLILNSQETKLMTYDTKRCAMKIRKHIQVFSNKVVLLPFCISNHWVLYAICNLDMGDPILLMLNSLTQSVRNDVLGYIQNFLSERAQLEKDDEHSLEVIIADTSKQRNSYDCGLYILKYAELLIHTFGEHGRIARDFSCFFPESSIEKLRCDILRSMPQDTVSTLNESPHDTKPVPCTNIFQKEISNFEKSLSVLLKEESSVSVDDYNYGEWTVVHSCSVTDVDSFRRSFPFLQGSFKSQGWKRNKFLEGFEPNQKVFHQHNSWPNPVTSGRWIYKCPESYGKSVYAMYEYFNCTNLLCQESECNAMWMWQMSYKDVPVVSVKCFGRHGSKWRPTPNLMRGVSVEQKLIAKEQKQKYRNTTSCIANSLDASKKKLQNFFDHEYRKRLLHPNHFEAFKLMLIQIMEKEDRDLEIIIPNDDLESCTITNFSVLLLSKNLIEYARQNGRLFEIIGHDGVYKLTDQKVPINLYTTVTKKDFRGIVLGYSIASDNTQKKLEPLIKNFLLYLRRTYPTEYKQPHFSVDEEKSQINALKSLHLRFNICRFHLVRSWKKHVVKKVDVDHRGTVAECLLRLLATKNNDEYKEEYDHFTEICSERAPQFLQYYNTEHHDWAEYWNLSDRCLRNNSLGSTNNVTESAIRLLQKDVSSRFKRFDSLLEHIMKFTHDQLGKHKFNPSHMNETKKQLQDRLEKAQDLYEQGKVIEMLESPFMFNVASYGVDIQYCFCTCGDYSTKMRICKHINAGFIYFAVKLGMKNLPKDAYDFHQEILDTLQRYQQTNFLDKELEERGIAGRSKKVANPTRRSGRKVTNKSLKAVAALSQYEPSEIERIIGVAKDAMGRVFYRVVWVDDQKEKWIDVLLIEGVKYMVKQFLCDLNDTINSTSAGELNDKEVYSIIKEKGKYQIELFDSADLSDIDFTNVVACKIFMSSFAL